VGVSRDQRVEAQRSVEHQVYLGREGTMGKSMVLSGTPTTSPPPTPATPEDTAFEYFVNRKFFGNGTPSPAGGTLAG
jgi:hypothetical protein